MAAEHDRNLHSKVSLLIKYWNENNEEKKELYDNFCEKGNKLKLNPRDCEQIFHNISKYEKNRISDIISNLLKTNPVRSDNALQPSLADNFLLKLIEPFNNLLTDIKSPYTTNKRKWEASMQLLRDVIDVNGLRRVSGDPRKEQQNISLDLENRSEIILRKVRNSGVYVVKLIDGHGRIIYRCINKLLQTEFFDRGGIIQAYDIDPMTNLWHNQTLPSYDDVNVVFEQNVFGDGGYSSENIVSKESLDDSIVYLNFSGIGGDSARILIDIINRLDDNSLDNLIISFSYVRGSRTQSNINHLIGTLISRDFMCLERDDFITFSRDDREESLKRDKILSDCRLKPLFKKYTDDLLSKSYEERVVDIMPEEIDEIDREITLLNSQQREIARLLRGSGYNEDLYSSFYLTNSRLQDLLLRKQMQIRQRENM